MGSPIDRIAANADAGALANPPAGELPNRLVSERAAAGDDTNGTFLVNVARRDADAAAAVRVPAFARRDNARTIRADQPRLAALHGALHLDHVIHRNAFGDADDQIESGIDGFKDRLASEGRWNENRGRGRARLLRGFGHSVEDRHFVFKKLAAFAGRDAGDDLRAVFETQLGVPRAEAAGDALDQDLGLGSDEDGHAKITIYDLRFGISLAPQRTQSRSGSFWSPFVNADGIAVRVENHRHAADRGRDRLDAEFHAFRAQVLDGLVEVFNF